jgi:cytochrome bd-type quinol oxidase subunit 1
MVGSHLGVIETKYQPMKIAAAERQLEHVRAVLLLAVPDRRREQ